MPASGSFLTEAGALEIAAFVESALSGVAMTTLAPAMDAEPVTLAVNYFRPTRPESGNLLARARVVNASRLYTFSEVEIEEAAGDLTSLRFLTIVDQPAAPTAAEAARFD